MNSRLTLAIVRWSLATVALAGIVLVYKRWLHVNPTTVALSLLLLVLVVAAYWGLRYAIILSIAAAACYNFFFLPPFDTFTIADTQNWLALLSFIATSIVASRLSQRAREEADEAKARQAELDILFRLSRELLQSESAGALQSSLATKVLGITSAEAGYLYLLEGNRLYQAGNSSISERELSHFEQVATTLTTTQAEGERLLIPIRSGARPRGLLALSLPHISTSTADAMGGLVSLALDRAQALETVARGEAAKESDRLRTLMVDSITHELRTPLTSIKGAATTLLSANLPREDSLELLRIIDEETDRLNHLISEAVDMSQLDAQQVKMHLQPRSVSHLVEDAIETTAWIRREHPVEVDIPDSIAVRVDATFFEKALCNLLENAAKYSQPGRPITISAERRNQEVFISVADQGTGIDPSEQSLIFERFYRSPHRLGAASGSGMGLAISRAIIQAHDGQISLTSQPGRGSVFTLLLPEA